MNTLTEHLEKSGKTMSKHPKTQGREIALQYLYMHDFLKGKEVQPLSDYMGSCTPKPGAETATFTRKLVDAVVDHQEELDAEITEVAKNWRLARMAIVDRNILRMGLAELIAFPETPYRVVLNEAIELARRYSSEASCAFVNGLLDKMRVKLRPDEEPGPDATPVTPTMAEESGSLATPVTPSEPGT